MKQNLKITKIKDILSNPELYAGKEVIIEAKFNGWNSPPNCDLNKTKAYLRSDTIIYDETSCIFISRNAEIYKFENKEFVKVAGLDPDLDVGAKIKVKAVVGLIDGKLILGK